MILEKKLEGTRQEEKMEAMMVIRTWLKARFDAREQLEGERRASNKASSMVFSSQNLPEIPSDGKDHEPKVRLLQYT